MLLLRGALRVNLPFSQAGNLWECPLVSTSFESRCLVFSYSDIEMAQEPPCAIINHAQHFLSLTEWLHLPAATLWSGKPK